MYSKHWLHCWDLEDANVSVKKACSVTCGSRPDSANVSSQVRIAMKKDLLVINSDPWPYFEFRSKEGMTVRLDP